MLHNMFGSCIRIKRKCNKTAHNNCNSNYNMQCHKFPHFMLIKGKQCTYIHMCNIVQQSRLLFPRVLHKINISVFVTMAIDSDELTPRKRARKQQLSEYSTQNLKCFQSDTPAQQQSFGTSYSETTPNITYITDTAPAPNQFSTLNNDENSPPKNVTYYIKRPKTITLLDVSSIPKSHA